MHYTVDRTRPVTPKKLALASTWFGFNNWSKVKSRLNEEVHDYCLLVILSATRWSPMLVKRTLRRTGGLDRAATTSCPDAEKAETDQSQRDGLGNPVVIVIDPERIVDVSCESSIVLHPG